MHLQLLPRSLFRHHKIEVPIYYRYQLLLMLLIHYLLAMMIFKIEVDTWRFVWYILWFVSAEILPMLVVNKLRKVENVMDFIDHYFLAKYIIPHTRTLLIDRLFSIWSNRTGRPYKNASVVVILWLFEEYDTAPSRTTGCYYHPFLSQVWFGTRGEPSNG